MHAKRDDVHRPSTIEPSDYEYVGQESIAIEGIGDCEFILAERRRIEEHQRRTGGHYSSHEHGGNCMVCGSVNAMYTILFYHAKTNSYVRMGADCAAKCEMSGDFGSKSAFRRAIEDAREAIAGKRKGIALLADYGLSRCWDIYTGRDCDRWEERTIGDIVSKLVKYGSISEKQQSFMRSLLTKIDSRADTEAKRAAEKEAADDCPEGRTTIEGVIAKIRVDAGPYGEVTKMLVKATQGFMVWGTRPSGIGWQQVGDKVKFTASLTRSESDSKFGFFKRPTNASLLQEGWKTPTFDVVARFEAGSATAKAYETVYP